MGGVEQRLAWRWQYRKAASHHIPWNPLKHPRDEEGQFATVGSTGGPAGGTGGSGAHKKPLSDTEYDKHIEDLQGNLNRAFKYGKTSSRQHTVNGDGVTYTPERAAQHKEIIDDLMKKYADVPNEGKAVISGGLGGAGKSTVLSKHSSIDPANYVTLNADDIKDIMAERDMIPRAKGISPLESAALVHDESRTIAIMLGDKMYAQKKNIIWDTTMSGDYVNDIIDELHDNGYNEVRGVFVDIPVETSVNRALARHREGLEDYRNGIGYGGRFVPPHIIRLSKAEHGEGSQNWDVFQGLKGRFDAWEQWDNSVDGQTPKLTGEKKIGEANPVESGTKKPLTDKEFEAHINRLQTKLDGAYKAGKSTSRMHTVNADGYTYRPERVEQHKEIVDELMKKYADVPREGKAIVSGGLPGAGKTTVLTNGSGVKPGQYASVSADDVKEMMAERGMIPQSKSGDISPMESSTLAHEESRTISAMFARRLYAERVNVVWDITMAGGSITKNLINELRNNNYRQIKAVFVDIPIETSVSRALARYRQGLEDHRNGVGLGGRYLPPHIIRASQSADYEGSHNRTVFERAKKYLDDWELWDNSVDGQEPKLVKKKGV